MGEEIQVRVNQNQEPPETPQEQLGEVALTDEQQALVALNSDPTHPRGNKELAEEMAHAGRENRSGAAEVRSGEKPDVPAGSSRFFDETASDLEGKAQERYLERHPEKVEQRDKEGLGLETQQWRKKNWVDEDTALQMVKWKYHEPKMQAENMRKNLEAAGAQSEKAAEVIAGLEKRADEIAEQSQSHIRQVRKHERREAEKEQRRFESLQESAAERVLGLVSGGVEMPKKGAIALAVDASFLDRGFPGDGPKVWVDDSLGYVRDQPDISPEHVYELRELIYTMMGAEPPKTDDFHYKNRHKGYNYPPTNLKERFLSWADAPSGDDQRSFFEAEVTTPGNMGFAIVEAREASFRNNGKSYGLEPGVTEGAEVKELVLRIVPTDILEESERKAA